jgi:vacuolar-type H+-ATPase subunit C/Vma6
MKGHIFNIDNGYLEGLCRGFKNGILRQGDYLNLVQCETLDDLKLHLQERRRSKSQNWDAIETHYNRRDSSNLML